MRERIVEHVFVADLLRKLWRAGITSAEVLRSEFDAGGYDVVISLGAVMRHVQLKSTLAGGKAASVNVSLKLADKPSGCVVWFIVSPDLEIEKCLWFGGAPGEPLPPIGDYPVAKHTKANSLGEKLPRPNHRVIARSKFEKLPSFDILVERLLGCSLGSSSTLQATQEPTLDELIAGVTPENTHAETDWGPDVGKERFWEER
jgi:hypothetical protein